MTKLELFGSGACPYTRELREALEWRGAEFVEYDVETDSLARERLLRLSGGQRAVPVLVDGNRVIAVGWEGRTCTFSGECR